MYHYKNAGAGRVDVSVSPFFHRGMMRFILKTTPE